MTTANPTKSAAPTPGAQPAASQAGKETKGAKTAETPDHIFDVAAALGLPAEGQKTEAKTNEPVDIEAEATKADDESAAETESDDAAETDDTAAAESETPVTESDEVNEDSGGSNEEEPAAEGEAAPEPEGNKGKPNEGFQKRIDELTAARRTAESEASTLREQVATLRAAASGELASRPLDFVDTPEQLKTEKRKLVDLHKWALTHEDGGKLGEKEYSREEVAAIRADTYGQIQEDVPAREQWLAAKHAADLTAVNSYPWLKDTTSGNGQTIQQIVESYPQLRALPNYRLALANMVVAEKFRAAGLVLDETLFKRLSDEKAKRTARPAQSQPAAASTPTTLKPPLRRPAPSPGRPGTLPARLAPRAAQIRATEQRMMQPNSSMDDLAASIAAKLS